MQADLERRVKIVSKRVYPQRSAADCEVLMVNNNEQRLQFHLLMRRSLKLIQQLEREREGSALVLTLLSLSPLLRHHHQPFLRG